MAKRFLGLLTFLTIAAVSCFAGIATYTYNPYGIATPLAYATYNHLTPVVTRNYISDVPVLTKSYLAAAPYIKTGTAYVAPPLVRTYAAPTAYVATPSVVVKNVEPVAAIAPAPVVKAVTPVAAPAPAPRAAVIAAPVAVAQKTSVNLLRQVEEVEDFDASPRYDFSYGVHDSITGDIKSQVESRDGGNVVGSYSVIDADGFKRTVTYTADDINGFNAVVQREPITKLAAVTVTTPAVIAAPTTILQQQKLFLQQFPHQQQQQQPEVEQQEELKPIITEETHEQLVEQPQNEPKPIEYPEQQQLSQQELNQEAQSAAQEQQSYAPYPSATGPIQPVNIDDTDVVEARNTNENSYKVRKDVGARARAPAPVTEEFDESQTNEKKFN